MHKWLLAGATALVFTSGAQAQSFPEPGQVVSWEGLGQGGAAWSAGGAIVNGAFVCNCISRTTLSDRFDFVTGYNPDNTLYIEIDLTPIEHQKTDVSTGQLIWSRAQCNLTGADVVVSDGVALGYPAPTWMPAFFTFGGNGTGVYEAYNIVTGSATVKIQTADGSNFPSYSTFAFYVAGCVPR
jgi:hypothetical protein